MVEEHGHTFRSLCTKEKAEAKLAAALAASFDKPSQPAAAAWSRPSASCSAGTSGPGTSTAMGVEPTAAAQGQQQQDLPS